MKLEIIFVVLSLCFISLSCGSDNKNDKNTNGGKEYLEGVVKYGGSYTFTETEDNITTKTSLSFSTGNKVTISISNNVMKAVMSNTVSNVKTANTQGTRTVTMNITSCKVTILSETDANKANLGLYDSLFEDMFDSSSITDWKANKEKDVTNLLKQKTITQIFKVSSDKNSITFSPEDGSETTTVTYTN